MQFYTAELIYTQGRVLEGYYLAIENGTVQKLAPVAELDETQRNNLTHFPDALLIPGLVNSHNHSFQSLLKGFCDDCDFFTWRDQALYKYSKTLSRDDIYTGALFAFGEMLKAGITTVCDFFYINDQANDNARAVIEAALDVGIRIVMARCLYDWDGAPLRFRESLHQAVGNIEALHAEFKEHPLVHVIPAPHSLHGASTDMILAGAELAERLDTKFHMHIAEGQYERQMIEEKHGLPPVAFLDELGVLNNRLVGIHCVWLDDREIELMARRGTGLSYNPSSNMFLGDGITRIKEMLAAGVCISLGTDGGCSNNRASIIEEMRMTSLLQKVKFHDSTVTRAEDMLLMGTANGGRNLGLPVGTLEAGSVADFTVIDLNDLSMQPRQNALKNLVYASQPSAIRAVYVAGEKVFENGRLLTVPEAEIIRRVKLTTENWTAPVT
jgi:5-methylthioadenosine/S-adenosylhomocysteine deaminase